jgi:hypothetical protein
LEPGSVGGTASRQSHDDAAVRRLSRLLTPACGLNKLKPCRSTTTAAAIAATTSSSWFGVGKKWSAQNVRGIPLNG